MISTNTMSTKPADRSNDDDDNIAMYKAMLYNEDLNESIHSDNAFIGGSPTQSPSRKKKVSISPNPPHKWGKPMSPEQFRPDNWLGGCGSPDSTTGSSPSRSNKGYKVKSLSMALPNLPMEDEEDNKKKTSSSTTAASEALKAISPGGGGTGAGGAGVSSSPYYGKKRSTKMPKKFQSEGGKPSSYNNNNNNNSLLPPAFAASLNSPKTIMKKKSIGTLTSSPKPKKKVNGPSLSEFFGRESSNNENSERSDYDDDLSSSVPSAFRHTLNNGINTTTSSSSRRSVGGGYGYGGGLSSSLSVSNSSVIGKYGLMSPVASKKKKVFKVPSSSASTASYNNNNNNDATSPYADIRKRLKSVSRSDMSPKKNDGQQSGGGSIGVRRIQSMVGPRSLSSSNTNANERDGDCAEMGEASPKPKGSPGGRSISSVASAPSHVHHVSPSSTKQRALSVGSSSVSVDGGGSSSSLLSPKQPRRGRKPKSDLRMSPFRSNPRRGSEANSPMPPYSPNKRISAPPMIGSGSLLDLPFDDNDDDDVEDDDDKEKSKGIPPPPPPPLMEEEENEKGKSSPVVVSSTQKRTKNNGHKKVVGVDQKKFLKAMESVDETAGPPISSDPLQSSSGGGGGPKTYYKKRTKKPMKKPASMFDRTAPMMYTPSKASMSGSKGGGGGGGSSSSSKSKMPNRSKSVRSTSPTRNRISSSRGPHKNYSISPHARQRQSLMLDTSSRSLYSTESHGSNELSNLKDIISQLRKVQLPDISKVKKRKPIKNNEHESELLDIIKNLRKVARKTNPVKSSGADDNDDGDDAVGTNYVSNTLTELKNAGYIKSKITMDELDTIEDARSRLQKVHRRLDDREYNYGQMNIVLKKLDKLTTKARSSDGNNNNNVDAVPVLKEVIGKLKKMIPNLYADDKTETQDVINLLSGVVSKIGEREMDELAAVIRNFQVGRSGDDDDTDHDVDDDPEELANVIANLKSLNKGDLAGNDDKNDNDLLADAINRLRKVNMTEKDAEECGNMIRNLRKVSSGNGDKLLDDEIARLRASMGGSRSSVKKKTDEIAAVLKGLRKANLSDKGWDNLTDMVKSLRPGGGDVLPDEISKVINGLKKAKLNKWEAKEVAGIVFKLRKTNYPKRLPEEEEREFMVKLRKVLPKGKSDELFDLISNLRDAELDEGDIDALVDAIENAGDDDNNDGSGMIVQVPEGDSGPSEGLPLGSDWDRGVSLRERYASNRKNGKKDDDDDTDLDDVSISTVEGDDDDSSAREEASNSNIMNSDDKDGLDLGWNRKKKKAGGDDDSSGYEEASVTSDQELEAESPNSSKRFHFSGPVIYESDNLGNEELMSPGRSPGRKQKKIVFNQKPKWKHKKHNNCVVGEKRWRFQETFGADEVLFSPLSRDQYDRRKRISQSLLANLGDDLPFSDNDKKSSKKKDDDKVYTSEVVSDKVGEFMDRKKDTGRRSKYIITDESED